MADQSMNARQQAACARLILEITQDHHCALTIEADEVTVYEDGIPLGVSQHSHHRGPSLYHRLSEALGAAKVYSEHRYDETRAFEEAEQRRAAAKTGGG